MTPGTAATAAERIALFLPSFAGGGAERVMLTLAQGFSSQGYSTDLVVARGEGPLKNQVPGGVRIFDLKSPRVLSSLPKLVGYLRSERPAGLLSTLGHANVIALWAKALSRVPVRVIVRETSTPSIALAHASLRRSKWVMHLARLCYPMADGIVAVSKGAAEDFCRTAKISSDRVRVVYNPVLSPDLFARALEGVDHPWFSSGEPPVVLAVGRLTRAKDYPTLLRAFAQVRLSRRARLMILGEGEERAALETLARDLGVDADISFPGFVANPFPYMKRASAYVLSSAWEGLPNALIQALALGTPTVATDCPSGPREILQGGTLGHLVPVGRADLLSEAILGVLRGEGRAAKEKDLAPFHSETITRTYLQLILGGSPRG